MSTEEARLQSTVRAFMAARRRASVAEYETGHLLHMAIYDARACGLTVRATAQLLRVPKSTIARHWLAERARDLGVATSPEPPLWGTEEEFLDARRAIWAHDPSQIDVCPFIWTEQPDGSRTVSYLAPATLAVLDEVADSLPWVAIPYVDHLAQRVIERLHPEVEATREVLDAAKAAVRQDFAGAEAILKGNLEELDLGRQADLRTRRERGYYLPQ